MLRGSKKLRMAGSIEKISTIPMLILVLYMIIGIATEGYFAAEMWAVLVYQIYKLAVAIFAVKRSDKAESAYAIMGNSIVLFVISVLWLIYIFGFLLILPTDRLILTFICAVTDVAMLIQMIIGSFRNMNSDPEAGTLSVNPYGDNVPTQQQDNSTEQ